MAICDSMLSVAQGIAKGKAGKDFCFCLEEEKFYFYFNGYWKQLADLELMAIIMNTYTGNNGTLDIRQYTSTRRRQILDNLKQLVFQRLEVFNKNGYLNFDLGEFDPLTGKMHDHKKENYSTLRVDYPYRTTAEQKLWDKTLLGIFEGDKEKINILQEFFGYCLTRDTRKEKALLLLGESRTGKSTILEALSAMVGEHNCAFVPMDYICHPQYSPLLMNKLVNIDTDVSSKAEKFEREFKTITSGEPLTCNQKFVETFKFRPYCKMIMASNEFPMIKDHSSAFYKRLILLPCEKIFEDEEQNLHLKDELINELPSIFNWSVAGLKRLNVRGRFEQKNFMKDAIEELREQSNPVDLFLKEFIEVDLENEIFIEKGELYQEYKKWAVNNQQYALSAIKFGQAVYRKYAKYTEKNLQGVNGVRIWRNLKYNNIKNLRTWEQQEN